MAKLRKGKEAQQDHNVLVPLDTKFDYLNGAFSRAQKARRNYLFITLGALVVAGSFGLLGFQAQQTESQDLAAAQSATAVNETTKKRLAQLDQVNGISAAKLRTHAQTRFVGFKEAVAKETDVSQLINTLQGATPPGVQITSITLVDPTAATATVNPDGTPVAPVTPDPAAAPTDGAPATPAVPTEKTVSVVATGKSYDDAVQWTAALREVNGLKLTADPVIAGGPPAVTFTSTLTLLPSMQTNRAESLERLDQYGIPKGGN